MVGNAVSVIRSIDCIEAADDLLYFQSSVDLKRLVPTQNPAPTHHFPEIGYMIRAKMSQKYRVDICDWQVQIFHGSLGAVTSIK
jgi:hypothetical protein